MEGERAAEVMVTWPLALRVGGAVVCMLWEWMEEAHGLSAAGFNRDVNLGRHGRWEEGRGAKHT